MSGEYWSKRPGNEYGAIKSPFTKRRTHKKERQQGKEIVEELYGEYLEDRKGDHVEEEEIQEGSRQWRGGQAA